MFNDKDNYIEENSKFNKISTKTNILFNVIMILLVILSVTPFLFVIIISFTNEKSLMKYGYSFFPKQWSNKAYIFLFSGSSQLLKSYGVTIAITLIGTIIGLFVISTYAYVISRKDFKYKKFFTTLAFLPMLFSGGLVSSYLVMVKVLSLKNTIWALILPMIMNTWYVIILRTFFKTTVPEAVIESAKIDGASESRTFFQIVLPMALPGMATIALFLTLGFWNDWFNAMLYVDTQKLIPLQYLLIRIENSMEFLVNNASKLGISGVEVAANLPKESAKMAMVVLSTLPIIFAYPFFQKYFISGLTIGAVKE